MKITYTFISFRFSSIPLLNLKIRQRETILIQGKMITSLGQINKPGQK